MRKTFLTLCLILFALPSWGVTMSDLVKRDGVYYQQYSLRDGVYYKLLSPIPFTGKVTGEWNGSFKDGKRVGSWVYYSNGQLFWKGKFKNGKLIGEPIFFNKDGTIKSKEKH